MLGSNATPTPVMETASTPRLLLQSDQTALYWAAANNCFDALSTLLAAGANPAAPDKVWGRGSGSRKGSRIPLSLG